MRTQDCARVGNPERKPIADLHTKLRIRVPLNGLNPDMRRVTRREIVNVLGCGAQDFEAAQRTRRKLPR